MKKRRIKSSNKNTKKSVDDIRNKALKEIRKELMARGKDTEHSNEVGNTEDTLINEPSTKDNKANTPKKRCRKKKEAEPIKENGSLSVEDNIDYSQIKEPKNNKLNKAKKAKNDEFYTDYSEIEKELAHYTEHFKDKVVLCNCDDPYYSEFWKYFKARFKTLELKKLIGTHYDNKNLPSYAIEFSRDESYSLSYKDSEKLRERYNTTDFDLDNISDCKIHWLNGDGDFRSSECLEYLKECDTVVTNPPLSMFKEFVSVVVSYNKKFLVLGTNNVVTYKNFFPLLLSNKVWAGFTFNKVMDFIMPDNYELTGNGYIDKDGRKHGFVSSMSWFTNMPIKKRKEDLILYKLYNETDYPKYDNYDAINVDKVKDIPINYDGIMGVPITFLGKYNPNQFEIVGCTESECRGASNGLWHESSGVCQALVNGKKKYKRLFIRRKHSQFKEK